MRRVFALILLLVLALSLAGCGSKKDAAPAPTASAGSALGQAPAAPEETEPPKVTDSPADGQVPDSAQPATPAEVMAIAESFVGRPVEELYAAIGQPLDSSYAPSCLVPDQAGEDGELIYKGFVVSTYRFDGSEQVESVYPAEDGNGNG